MDPYRPTFIYMNPFRAIWIPMTWVQMDPNVSLWIYMDAYVKIKISRQKTKDKSWITPAL